MARIHFTPRDYASSLGMFVYASSVVITPIILVVISRELGFGLGAAGAIEAVRAWVIVIILLGSGWAAGHIGLIRSLTSGSLVLTAGFLTYAFATSYAMVLVAIVLVGLGSGVLEALLNPLVQEEHPEDSGKYLNIVNAFFSLGVLITVLLTGDLLTRGVSWRVLVAALAALSGGSALLFVITRSSRTSATPTSSDNQTSLWAHTRDFARKPLFWWYTAAMFAGGGAEGAFTFWSASYIQLHFGAVARAGAAGTAVFAAGMALGRLSSGHIVRQEHLDRLIIASAIVGCVVSIGAWAASALWLFWVALFGAGVSIACFWPSIQSHAADVIGGDSTTLFILLSMGGVPGFGISSFVMGLIAERSGLRDSLWVIPALLAFLTVTMIFAGRERRKNHLS